jgi:mannose-1-phosphate guanylyltransferase / mannose-6-phosphate isomerase
MKILILAGGSGTRLWPLSNSTYPKQFLCFGDKYSLLQKTLLRFLASFNPEDIFIITQKAYHPLILEHARVIDHRFSSQVILEPMKRNTAPAIAFGVRFLQDMKKLSEGECLLVASSDHLIFPEKTFLDSIQLAEEEAKRGAIVTFGIRPHKPETGYGYLKIAHAEGKICSVEQFTEKPSLSVAQQFLLSGNYLWNAGIFVFETLSFFQKLQRHCPEIACRASCLEEMTSNYDSFPNISIDYALLERCADIKAIPLDVSWSDVGSWNSLYDILEKDDQNNVKIGNIAATDTKRCIIIGGKRLISTFGLEEMVIVETDEALFLSKKDKLMGERFSLFPGKSE